MRTIFALIGCFLLSAVAAAQPPPIPAPVQVRPPVIIVTAPPTGTGSGTPCTTTALSVQYNAAGSFGCISGVTSDGTSLTAVNIKAGSKIFPASDTTTALLFTKADTTTAMLTFDSTNGRLIAGGTSASFAAEFANSGNSLFGTNSIGINGTSGHTVIGPNNFIGWSSAGISITSLTPDTGLARESAAVVKVNNGSTGYGTIDAAAFQTNSLAHQYFVTTDFTTSGVGTSLELITGLTWTFPASTAINIPFTCSLSYNQNVATAAVAFGVRDVTVAPTNAHVMAGIGTSTTAGTAGNADITNTTATAVVSATPSVITTVFNATIDGFIEQPSNASTSAFQIMVSTATAADTVTIKRGSFCKLGS